MRLLTDLVDKQQSNASTPDTAEYKYMEAEQAKINAHNAEQKRKKLWEQKQKLTPTCLFSYEKLVWDNKKSRLNFAWYAFNVYIKLLFSYYKRL